MLASDETMLASFGDAKIWPAYMFFGNESKYKRGRSNLNLLEEIAYFQTVRIVLPCSRKWWFLIDRKLPDSFNDWYIQESGKNTVAEDLMRYVKRELFQAQWKLLLDDDFVHAYRHGLVVDCPDKTRRRFYPRILTYTADYPER